MFSDFYLIKVITMKLHILIIQNTGTATTLGKEYKYREQQWNIRMVQNENLHKILHKNGKRDWMYDAAEKRQLVIKPQ